MSRTQRRMPDVHREMAEVFKRKSGPQIRPTSRTKEREMWEREWKEEVQDDQDSSENILGY